jgi:casein kinase II subunit beta
VRPAADDGTGRRRRNREELMEVEASVPEMVSTASVALKADRYRPRIYGFQLNETAKLQRWQEAVRDRWESSFSLVDKRN